MKRTARAPLRHTPARLAPRSLRLAVQHALLVGGLGLTVAPIATAALFPAMIDVSTLASGDGSTGFVLNGSDAFDFSGRSVDSAGDINGDGIDDLIIGAMHIETPDGTEPGESYVVFGRPADGDAAFPASFELASLASGDGDEGFVLVGIAGDDGSGSSVSAAGDINGDGIDDLVIGAYRAAPGGRDDAGESYVVFGRNTAQAGNFPATFELASLLPANGGDGSNGFVLEGIAALDSAGIAVSAAGDFNGDGIDDVIVGADQRDDENPGTGESYVIFGRDTAQAGDFAAVIELASLLPENGGDGSEGVVLRGIDVGDCAGHSVAAAGDVNGDGLSDLLVGAYAAATSGRTDAGETYVVFGRSTAFPALFELASLLPANGGDGSQGFVLTGIDPGDFSGLSVNTAGDVDGDAIADLIVGAVNADPGGVSNAGESYVVYGRDTVQGSDFPAAFALSRLLAANGGDGTEGFVLNGHAGFSGASVSAAGDVNGDGHGDVIVGAPNTDANGQSLSGESYVVFGRDAFPAEFALASLLPDEGGDGTAGFALNGAGNFGLLGQGVSGGGDFNGDGVDDVIAGAFGAVANELTLAGQTFVIYGRLDSDADGVGDAADNCTTVANTDQRDADGDGIGSLCDADFDNSCVVNFLDLGTMKESFFTADPGTDMDGSGSVNFLDLGLLKGDFFQPPGPSGVPNVCDES